jgi:prepilin-type N-terminal cleavage/methylation domain-containing protein
MIVRSIKRFFRRRAGAFTSRWTQFWPELLTGQEGFSLVEVLVSIVVISTTSVALAGAMSTGYLGYRVAEKDMTAVQLATDQLEFTKSDVYLAPPATYPPIPSVPTGYGITSVASAVPGRDANLELITVTVTHNGSTKLVIDGYKANR